MSKINIFTNIAPHYRKPLWVKLLRLSNAKLQFFYGNSSQLGIPSIDFEEADLRQYQTCLNRIKNFWIKDKVLIWQKGVINKCMTDKFHAAIFLGEMYCISTWLAAIICRLRLKKVAFWGHGIYGNEGMAKLVLRKTFYRLAHKHLLYERRSKQIMVREGFKPDNLYVVFNSLDYDAHKILRLKFQDLNKSEVFSFLTNPTLPVLVFIGRLTAEKKLDMLLKAANQINREQILVNLVFIGDGPVKENLIIQGEKGLGNGWLHFTGACYIEEEIGRYLWISDLCISPGNIGLTAIHSLSFGTPVCTHSNFNNQGPEVGAIIDGYNGFFFEENNDVDLVTKIKQWIVHQSDRQKLRHQCFEIIDQYYNPNYQTAVFSRMFVNGKPDF